MRIKKKRVKIIHWNISKRSHPVYVLRKYEDELQTFEGIEAKVRYRKNMAKGRFLGAPSSHALSNIWKITRKWFKVVNLENEIRNYSSGIEEDKKAKDTDRMD